MAKILITIIVFFAYESLSLQFRSFSSTISLRNSNAQDSMKLFAGFGGKPAGSSDAKKVSEERAPLPCACLSGKVYSECCLPYHNGSKIPATPTATVRSRFSALAYKLEPSYLISTTHPEHKEFVDPEEQKSKAKQWERALKEFASEYEFIDLCFDDENRDGSVSIDNSPDGTRAKVFFNAKMIKAGLGERQSETLVETSEFLLTKGRWLYRDAVVNNPFKNIQPEVAPKKQKFITTAKRGVPRGN